MLMEVPSLRAYSGQLFTIVSELYNNALDHGVLGMASEIKQQANGFERFYQIRQQTLAELTKGFVHFQLQYDGDNDGGKLLIEVIDSGEGFDHVAAFKNPDAAGQLHGRGISLIRSVCDEVCYIGKGNQVNVTFSWSEKS